MTVKVANLVQQVYFNRHSFLNRFQVDSINENELVGLVFRVKAKLILKKEEKNDDPEFKHLVRLLYENWDPRSATNFNGVCRYSEQQKKTIRLSKKRFFLPMSCTIQEKLVAIDIKQTLKAGPTTVKMARLLNGEKIVRCISPFDERLFKIAACFSKVPHVLPTLATVRYINSKQREVFVSYHPFYQSNLDKYLRNSKQLSYPTQISIAWQILLGMVRINKEGVHGNLSLDNIFLQFNTENIEIVIGGLGKFAFREEQIQAAQGDWRAPETQTNEHPVFRNEKQDVWELGTIFQTLFQKRLEYHIGFTKCSQDQIDTVIRRREFPPPIAEMIQGMLQVDPAKRWSFQQVVDHFSNAVLGEFNQLIEPLRRNDIAPSTLEALQAYACKCQKTIRFSAEYFQLRHSATATPRLAALDFPKSCMNNNRAKIKLALLPNNEKVIRRICEYDPDWETTLNLFLQTPYVLPTLEIARYTNKGGMNTLVSFHPRFEMDLDQFLIQMERLDFDTQINIGRQIAFGLEQIHLKGIHGDLYSRNILIKGRDVVISDLETFEPHDFSSQKHYPIATNWSAPEVRNNPEQEASAEQDLWSLGLIFYSLFQTENRTYRYFRNSTQEEIDANIKSNKYPPSVAFMISSMLQIDPEKRIGSTQLCEYFRLNFPEDDEKVDQA